MEIFEEPKALNIKQKSTEKGIEKNGEPTKLGLTSVSHSVSCSLPSPLKLNEKTNTSTDNQPKALNIKTSSNSLRLDPEDGILKLSEKANQPTALNMLGISAKNQIFGQEELNFSFSFEFLKSKIPQLDRTSYKEVANILEKIQRKFNYVDSDVLVIGKGLQDEIGNFNTQIMSNNIFIKLEEEVINSHRKVADIVAETSGVKEESKSFSSNLLSMFSSQKSITLSKQEAIDELNKAINKNKSYRPEIESSLNKLIPINIKLEYLINKLSIYIEVCKILKEEFILEGFEGNVDMLNRRVESLVSSSALLFTTKAFIETYNNRLLMLRENIDNVINILIPSFITKLSIISSNTISEELKQMSENIVSKLEYKN